MGEHAACYRSSAVPKEILGPIGARCARADNPTDEAIVRVFFELFGVDADVLGKPHVESELISVVVPWLRGLVTKVHRTQCAQDAMVVMGGWRRRSVALPLTGEQTGSIEVVLLDAPYSAASVRPPLPADANFVHLGPLDCLSPRELEVFAYFGTGASLREIAAEFDRSIKTVKRFRDGLAEKLKISNRVRLALLAQNLGLEPRHASLPRIPFSGDVPTALSALLDAYASRTLSNGAKCAARQD